MIRSRVPPHPNPLPKGEGRGEGEESTDGASGSSNGQAGLPHITIAGRRPLCSCSGGARGTQYIRMTPSMNPQGARIKSRLRDTFL